MKNKKNGFYWVDKGEGSLSVMEVKDGEARSCGSAWHPLKYWEDTKWLSRIPEPKPEFRVEPHWSYVH